MPAKRTPTISEKHIESSIISFLKWRGVFCFKVENGGVYDEARGKYRFNPSNRMKGVADILGIFEGRFLAIEVKSAKGKLRPEQLEFLNQVNRLGGIAFVARSVEAVAKELELPL